MLSPCDPPHDPSGSRAQSAVSVAGLAALVLVGFLPLVRHPHWLLANGDAPSVDHARPVGTSSVGNDLTRLFLPLHLRISEVVRRTGFAPGWDPAGFGGRPLVGNPQASLWYPPVWVMWWTGNPALLGWLTVGHLAWAGIGAYVLARSRAVGIAGSFLAGATFELSPYFLAQTMEGHLPHVWSASWYPWAFLGALALREGRWKVGLFLPPILAMGFLAGHPQESYYLVLTLAIWLLISVVRWPRARVLRALAIVGLVLAVMIGLTAVEWLPDAQAQVWGLKRGLSSRRASGYSVGWGNWLQLVGPGVLGGASDYVGETNYWDSLLSFGMVPLAFAIVAVFSSNRRREVRGWLALSLFAVAFSMGPRLGLFSLMYRVVPGMDRFRVPSRALFLASLGVAMLAGMGLDALRAVCIRLADGKRGQAPGRGAFLSETEVLWAGSQSPFSWRVRNSMENCSRKQGARSRVLMALGGSVVVALVGGLLAESVRQTGYQNASLWVLGLRNLAHDPVVWLCAIGLTGAGGLACLAARETGEGGGISWCSVPD